MGEHRRKRFCAVVLSFLAMTLPCALAASQGGTRNPAFETDPFQDAAFQESFLISRADRILEQRMERLELAWAEADRSLPFGLDAQSQTPSLDAVRSLVLAGPPTFGGPAAAGRIRPFENRQFSIKTQAPSAGHYSLRNHLEGHERTGPPRGTHP